MRLVRRRAALAAAGHTPSRPSPIKGEGFEFKALFSLPLDGGGPGVGWVPAPTGGE